MSDTTNEELKNALHELELAEAALDLAQQNVDDAQAYVFALAPFQPGELVMLRPGVEYKMRDGGYVYVDNVEWWGDHYRYAISRRRKDGTKHQNTFASCLKAEHFEKVSHG